VTQHRALGGERISSRSVEQAVRHARANCAITIGGRLRSCSPVFGKKRPSPNPSLLTPDLIQLVAVASVELTAKHAAARETWGMGTADR
jgi:hypothetical protein